MTGTLGEYFYDGDGKRVKKISFENNQWITTVFIYDASGKMVAEYSTQVASQQDAKVSYLTSDHLGSPRITTDANGQVISRRDFMPFGEEIARADYGTDEVRQKFTSYERDNESGLDFAQARMFSTNLGRFTSPDPALLSARTINPQTLNRYAYVLNNPLLYVDPFGLWEMQYEPEYEKNKDGTYDTSKVKRIKIFFVKTKDGDNADSLLGQLGFNSKDSGYDKMKAKIEGAISNITTTEFGTTGILASSLNGSVAGIQIGGGNGIFSVAEEQLGEQANFDVENHGNQKDGSDDNPVYCDCSMTAGRLAGFGNEISEGYGNWSTIATDSQLLDRMSTVTGNGRLGDMFTYSFQPNRSTHFANIVFTGDDKITQVFSRSGENGRFEVLPTSGQGSARLNGYGSIMPRSSRETGVYRKK